MGHVAGHLPSPLCWLASAVQDAGVAARVRLSEQEKRCRRGQHKCLQEEFPLNGWTGGRPKTTNRVCNTTSFVPNRDRSWFEEPIHRRTWRQVDEIWSTDRRCFFVNHEVIIWSRQESLEAGSRHKLDTDYKRMSETLQFPQN